jgi:hypothetical protein
MSRRWVTGFSLTESIWGQWLDDGLGSKIGDPDRATQVADRTRD